LSSTGRLEAAINLYREARAVFDAHGHDTDMLLADANLAIAYQRVGRHDDAIALTRRVITSAAALGDTYLVAAASTRLARTLMTVGQPEAALAVLTEVDPEQLGRDNVAERARHDVAKALALWQTGAIAEAGELAAQVVDRLGGSPFLSELARAHALLSDVALAGGDEEAGVRHRSHAIALHLAADDEAEATDLSRYFLPEEHKVISLDDV
jgi:tetratricopeptide (TPR) repeat protein